MRRFLSWGVVGYLILSIGFLYLGTGNYFRSLEGEKAKQALCAQNQNLKKQVAASEKYLLDVKEGRREAIPGLTKADVQAGIDRQKATIRAFRVLDCP